MESRPVTDQQRTSHHITSIHYPYTKCSTSLTGENKCLYIANIWPSLPYCDLVTSPLLLSDNQEKIPDGGKEGAWCGVGTR